MEYIKNLKPNQFRLIRHAASQIAGRKAKRTTHNYNIPRNQQIRDHNSPYKDIADSSKNDVLQYLNEDSHQNDHIFQALVHSVDLMHRHVKHHTEAGGSLSDHLNKIKRTLGSLANTAKVNIDVTADDFLNRIGLRHEKKFKNGKISDTFRDHATLHKDAYMKLAERKGTDKYDYLKQDSTDKYATYKHKQNGNVVVAFRGTKPDSALLNHDAMKDLHIATGHVGKLDHMDDYVNHVQKMIKHHGSGNVSLSGYSLGGAEAVHLTQDKRIRSHLGQTVALAPGHSPLDDLHKAKATDHKIAYLYHHNDAVANNLLQHSGTNHTVLYNETNPIRSHLFLDRLAND